MIFVKGGSAAAQCGKPMAFQVVILFFEAMPLRISEA